MVNVAVLYHSGSGHTRIMAEAVRDGAASEAGVEAQLYAIVGADIAEGRWKGDEILESLDAADAIIFGCPTYMGSVSAQMKAFLDATLQRWTSRAWVDKVAAGFTVSSTPSGDKLNALTTISICAMQLGMIWVGLDQTPLNSQGLNRLSFYLGAGGQAQYGGPEVAIHSGDRETGGLLGARVARVTRTLHLGSRAMPAPGP